MFINSSHICLIRPINKARAYVRLALGRLPPRFRPCAVIFGAMRVQALGSVRELERVQVRVQAPGQARESVLETAQVLAQ